MKLNDVFVSMIEFDRGDARRIQHFVKVHAFAKLIGELENIAEDELYTLEIAAYVHDIGILESERIYGDSNGKHQEEESGPLVEAFFADLPVGTLKVDRIKWLVEHHHTYTNVEGMDYQILLEADFLVNAGESNYAKDAIENACVNIFRTETGIHLLKSMYL